MDHRAQNDYASYLDVEAIDLVESAAVLAVRRQKLGHDRERLDIQNVRGKRRALSNQTFDVSMEKEEPTPKKFVTPIR